MDGLEAAITWTPGGGLWDRLVNLFRFPCPTSSATRAQVWLDLKSNGLPVLTIGVALAIVILLVSAVSGPIDAAINADPVCLARSGNAFTPEHCPRSLRRSRCSSCCVLGGNAFGIRRRQGRAYISAFEATHAHGTAQLAALKVLVKSVCVLAAIIAIGVSVWISVPLLGDAVFIQMWNVPLSSQLSGINGAVAALTGYEQLSLVVVAAVGVVIWVAAFAVLGALRTRYSRRVNIAASSAVALWSRARLVGGGGPNGSRNRIAVPSRRRLRSNALDRRRRDGVHDRLRLLERLRGARADHSLRERRRRDLGGIRGGMADSAAHGRRAACRDVCDERRLDTVAGVAAADGQRPGALVAQPHSPYVKKQVVRFATSAG